jgi:thiamine-monophosphate kinase
VLGRAPQIIHPRLEAGQRLRNLASAAIDLSDGLSTDLNHLAAASRVGAIVEAQRIPRSASLAQALNRGEDYELLFTARPDARIPSRIAGVAVNRIGLITSGRRVLLERPNGKREKLAPGGWEHFRD